MPKNFLLAAVLCAAPPAAAISLEWDSAKAEFITPGVYARLKKLPGGDLALVYSRGAAVFIKKQKDGVWLPPVRAATGAETGWNYTNAELAPLADGRLLYVWNARPKKPGGAHPYKIMAAFSSDGGASWGAPTDLHEAGSGKGDGCYEPFALQLPDGEIQIWFADEHSVPGRDQAILVLRSRDGGETWLPPVTASYRKGCRDGMPAPALLRDNTLVAAIEDNGLRGRHFKPAIVCPDAAFSETIGGGSPRRWGALAASCALPPEVYAGAPCLLQLDSGETILSVQSTEGRRPPAKNAPPTSYANLRVYVGDSAARNFANPTTPLPGLPENAAALWAALCQTSPGTLVAVVSLSGLPKNNGIWIIPAKIKRNPGM